jgi:hypothetical protein
MKMLLPSMLMFPVQLLLLQVLLTTMMLPTVLLALMMTMLLQVLLTMTPQFHLHSPLRIMVSALLLLTISFRLPIHKDLFQSAFPGRSRL